MPFDWILEQILNNAKELLESVESGKPMPALGLRRSAHLPVVAALHRGLKRPILLITDRADHALNLFDELSLWASQARRYLFPEPNCLFYENAPWNDTIRRERLLVFSMLASLHLPGGKAREDAPIIVAPARAVITRTMPRRDFLKATRTFRPGENIKLDGLIHHWVSLGYEPVNTVLNPGQFAHRGGILDLWPPASEQPVRIELFGDEIETLRPFEPTSQRTLPTRLASLIVSPAREYIYPLDDHLADGLPQAGEICEFHLPLLHPQPASLLDYLPSRALVLVDNWQDFQDAVAEIEEQAVKMRREAVADGNLSENFPIPYLSWSEILDTLPKHQVVELGLSADPEQTQPSWLAERFLPGPRFGGQVKTFIDHLFSKANHAEPAVVVSRQSSRLQELWQERVHPIEQALAAPPEFIQASLSEGWSFLPAEGAPIHLLTDGEIFGWKRPEPRQRPRQVVESPEALYADLQPGDYVVHADHGIGIFIGLVTRTIDGMEREYLCVEYADEAQLYVPIYQADRLTRYIGPDNRLPSLSRLGGTEWRTTRNQVKEAVREVAEDLLDLYARRNIVRGHAFPADTPWQHELEASFPYVETEDQLRVLNEVKRDMESPRPMDRLICGDVGYGKTEVALRAAFKAVNDGKQVAVLVPTTVLAQQHFNTFRERLAAFPVVVEMLSRFRTPQEQREILSQLKKGAIDIVIGTHRLLSPDVEFKDLGLLIIDEEQRFGVSHKERLKKMRTEVDVLTLTATPIPRTLYMALTGVRDISTISTPPEERLPIITHVGPYSPKLVRQAILRELERGGQVFFVHNRVQTIEAMRKHLEQLVPEARITVAHGQMDEQELAAHMEQFTNGEVDVLLSTSIIESGLDIPNANTLIVDRADTFGLAQLYQLRGRVGRGAQRAYAYFFRHKQRPPTLEGRQRLETIAENSQLGAGYSIAMRDLEIRGAGELLGVRQHGHIAAVGFHLYTRLLAAAVRRLQRSEGLPLTPLPAALQVDEASKVNIDLPVPVGIPASYVPDKGMRLRLYRRLADVRSFSEVEALEEEFRDRFGPLPEPVRNLLFQLKVRLLAERAGLAAIGGENGQLVFRYPDDHIPSSLPDLGSYIRVGKTALWMPLAPIPDWRAYLLEVLEKLSAQSTPVANGERRVS